MNNKPKYYLSIIIPTYNVETYIVETIESIKKQQTMYSFEILFVDDGSCDNTINIIKKYIAENENFKLLIQEHCGAGAARNYGIREANGEYIYFLDSDDILKNNMIEYLIKKMVEHQLDSIYFSAETFIDSDCESLEFKPDYSRIDFCSYNSEEFFIKMWNSKTYSPSPCLYITKREILIKNNLLFPEKIIHEDNYFTFFLVMSCEKQMSVNKCFYRRRIRNGSVMTGKKKYFSCLSLIIVYEKSIEKIISEYHYKGICERKYINYLYKNIFYEYGMLNLREKKKLKKKVELVKKDYTSVYPYMNAIAYHYYYCLRRIAGRILWKYLK